MSDKTIAQGTCLICGGSAEVRRNVKGKLYVFCEASCGLVQATGNGAQAKLAAMIPAGDGTANNDKQSDLPGLETTPPAPAKKGLFQSILDAQVL